MSHLISTMERAALTESLTTSRYTSMQSQSNHPPNIIKQLLDSFSRRISDNSCNEDEFNKAMTEYETALKSSGHKIFSSDQDLLLVKGKKKKKRKKNHFCPLPWAVQVLDQGQCLSEG